MTLTTPLSLAELANSSMPINEHLTPGTQVRHSTQQPEWYGGEVVLAATAETVTLAPYKKDSFELNPVEINYGLTVVIDRRKPKDREKLAQYEIIGHNEVP